ncbi:MAG: GNAT family N-acetyltransferase [Trueperaceae bacterium]|nr:GNAT family N-acetyltransferase [Trueperaceae bacterium]
MHIPSLPRPRPECVTLEGRYARLEPLDPTRHGAALREATFATGSEARLRYVPDVPADAVGYRSWLEATAASEDPLFFAVIDRAGERCEGRQALMRVDPEHGVIELGHIVWGPVIARTRVATEAFALAATYALDVLGYRRLEWKCHAENAASRRAAERFGFTYEGTFRQHMVAKGTNRDTAWFSLLDHEWPEIRERLDAWLAPTNFDEAGRQRASLAHVR